MKKDKSRQQAVGGTCTDCFESCKKNGKQQTVGTGVLAAFGWFRAVMNTHRRPVLLATLRRRFWRRRRLWLLILEVPDSCEIQVAAKSFDIFWLLDVASNWQASVKSLLIVTVVSLFEFYIRDRSDHQFTDLREIRTPLEAFQVVEALRCRKCFTGVMRSGRTEATKRLHRKESAESRQRIAEKNLWDAMPGRSLLWTGRVWEKSTERHAGITLAKSV